MRREGEHKKRRRREGEKEERREKSGEEEEEIGEENIINIYIRNELYLQHKTSHPTNTHMRLGGPVLHHNASGCILTDVKISFHLNLLFSIYHIVYCLLLILISIYTQPLASYFLCSLMS